MRQVSLVPCLAVDLHALHIHILGRVVFRLDHTTLSIGQVQRDLIEDRAADGVFRHRVLQLAASPESPLVNPAIVVKDWPAGATVLVEVNGEPATANDIKIGLEQELEGDHLVVWLSLESVEPIEVRISPVH